MQDKYFYLGELGLLKKLTDPDHPETMMQLDRLPTARLQAVTALLKQFDEGGNTDLAHQLIFQVVPLVYAKAATVDGENTWKVMASTGERRVTRSKSGTYACAPYPKNQRDQPVADHDGNCAEILAVQIMFPAPKPTASEAKPPGTKATSAAA
jgi:hypothetical protein